MIRWIFLFVQVKLREDAISVDQLPLLVHPKKNLHSWQIDIAMENGPGLKMYFLLEMEIFQPAILVYQSLTCFTSKWWFPKSDSPENPADFQVNYVKLQGGQLIG